MKPSRIDRLIHLCFIVPPRSASHARRLVCPRLSAQPGISRLHCLALPTSRHRSPSACARRYADMSARARVCVCVGARPRSDSFLFSFVVADASAKAEIRRSALEQLWRQLHTEWTAAERRGSAGESAPDSDPASSSAPSSSSSAPAETPVSEGLQLAAYLIVTVCFVFALPFFARSITELLHAHTHSCWRPAVTRIGTRDCWQRRAWRRACSAWWRSAAAIWRVSCTRRRIPRAAVVAVAAPAGSPTPRRCRQTCRLCCRPV